MMDDPIVLFEDPSECCGCGACACACPHHAISMQEDELGFVFPVIDDGMCARCGKSGWSTYYVKQIIQYDEYGVSSIFKQVKRMWVAVSDSRALQRPSTPTVKPFLMCL